MKQPHNTSASDPARGWITTQDSLIGRMSVELINNFFEEQAKKDKQMPRNEVRSISSIGQYFNPQQERLEESPFLGIF